MERLSLDTLSAADVVALPDKTNWTDATLTELVDHIEQTHHAYVRQELPRIAALAEKVVNSHGAKKPSLIELRALITDLAGEVEAHMAKEEKVLFPLCRELDEKDFTVFHKGTIRKPISLIIAEHEHCGGVLSKICTLTNNYTPPNWACGTYRAMLESLESFELDMHQHIHLETNILFGKALAAEARLQ